MDWHPKFPHAGWLSAWLKIRLAHIRKVLNHDAYDEIEC